MTKIASLEVTQLLIWLAKPSSMRSGHLWILRIGEEMLGQEIARMTHQEYSFSTSISHALLYKMTALPQNTESYNDMRS